jgi:micrococcal nuclease
LRIRNLLIGAAVFVVVVGSCNARRSAPTADPAGASQALSTASAAPTPTAAVAPSATPSGTTAAAAQEAIIVSKVIDGDTFLLSDGRKIRILGIDSCEANTYGGKEATSMAESQLTNPSNQPITMTSEPGVDLDRFGRHLRYVQLDGHDLGEFMVQYDHTGVYQGKNDAAQEYVARLTAGDVEFSSHPPAGRYCQNPYPSTSGSGGVDVDVPNGNHRDGALTGGFCARKRWC